MSDADTENLTLAADFPAADREAWRALAEAALKGAPFDKALTRRLAEGIVTEPIYAAGAAAVPADAATRNAGALTRMAGGWDIRQLHAHPDPKAVNKAVLADLERGAHSVILRLDRAGRRGGTALTDRGNAGVDGIMLHAFAALDTALDGVFVDAATVSLQPGGAFVATASMMTSLWEARGLDKAEVRGHLGADPLGSLAAEGMLPEPLPQSMTRMAKLAVDMAGTRPNVTSVSVDTSAYHGAGANEAMDLAYALSTGVAYLRAMEGQGLAVEAAAQQIEFSMPVGVDVFLGIAKLRAARRLWAEILGACGVAEDVRSMRLHVTTAANAWAGRDPWVNMLRATVATFAGSVGGADSITVLPYSHARGLPDGFARRIARNTQVILAEESNLAKVCDPAGGSWYVESMTDQLAAKAWERFRAIEAAGGMATHLTSGAAASECAEAWAERERRIAGRREELTGVNAFPKVDEAPVDVEEVDLDALVAAAAKALSGTTALDAMLGASGAVETIAAPTAHRLGEAFETLRDASDAAATRPTALLVLLGGPAMSTARATFARNHLGTGGVACVDADGDAGDLKSALSGAGTDLAVICSSDNIYTERATETAKALKTAGAREVLLAGRPGAHEADWAAAGIDGYIYAGDDTLAAVRGVLTRLGTLNEGGQ
ncbi:MAG: methylmalonyl-CoA mutase subunit beta [Thalassobaculaceae bacterium]|nr:methylmalonyl-CoA mutase subunit beta [Thalassobaculaceae bacterium]